MLGIVQLFRDFRFQKKNSILAKSPGKLGHLETTTNVPAGFLYEQIRLPRILGPLLRTGIGPLFSACKQRAKNSVRRELKTHMTT